MATSTNSSATHSIAELITEFHKTTGDVPPLLIGATTTLVNDHIYLFGGRIQSTRKISNSLYILSLKTHTWTLVQPENKPAGRYFHSANVYQHFIVFFGGMQIKGKGEISELLPCDDLAFFNIRTLSWEIPNLSDQSLPPPRYAHLSCLIKDRLIIMGGQDANNQYLQDIHVYNIKKKHWSLPLSSQQFQYGAYRSAAVAVTPIQLTPPFAPTMDNLSEGYDEASNATTAEDVKDITIHTYSNFSGAETTRQLHTWKLDYQTEQIELHDQSDGINLGHSLPPALRFPSAFMCGQQLILAGPHLSNTSHQFQIWALDTTSFIWTKIEVGHALARGSWLKGMLYEDKNRFVVFGHPNRTMQDDYRDRVNCYGYLASVDIEIFGVYKPPQSTFSSFGQSLGLALLKDPMIADLKITSIDSQHVMVNSAVLAQRWPSVEPLLQSILNPPLDGEVEGLDFEKRELSFPDTYVVLVAFLQFIYTDHLVTAQQHQPQILARLLLISDLFDVPRLKALATHSLHQMLNIQTATMIYESASLSNAISLQIRALRVMINAKKMMQRQKQIEMQNRQKQQQLQQQQQQTSSHQTNSFDRPFSPPPTPASIQSMISSNSSQTSSQYQGSRFLQKYDLSRSSSQGTIPSRSNVNLPREHTRPSTPSGFPFSLSASPTTSSNGQQELTSQRSMSSDASSIQSSQTQVSSSGSSGAQSGKSIKLPNFRLRQGSALPNTYGGDTDMSMSPSASSKLLTTAKSTGSFWRGTIGSAGQQPSKKKQALSDNGKHSKTEGRLHFMNYS
ncbi:hypothetical protein EDC96DRAFT_518513 [Choanephora cucurbitarum]|nr:hypothetical protein EDC96DRAFT_518513 [Choanephora cucurbitarum]